MKVEKHIRIILNERELKKAVYRWLVSNISKKYFNHMSKNHWIIEMDGPGCMISIDGTLPD